MKAEGSWNASGRNGRFINQKRTSGQIFKFGLRMADFIAEPFLSRACRIATLSRPLALASVILALGAGPLLLETTFRATAEASATAMANPRRRSRALRCSGAGGWPVGLPEAIFRATAKASAHSLPSFWRWGVAGRASRNKFPSDESGGILERVAAMAVLSTRSGQVARSLYPGCGWPISYCLVQGVYQRPSRAIFIKGWQNGDFSKAG